MNDLVQYSIPVKGLRAGIHEYQFAIKDGFFTHFEASPIEKADIMVNFYFDKRPDMYVLIFEVKGTVKSECDRCLVAIDLPIQSSEQLVVKFDEEETTDPDVVYISQSTAKLNIAKYIYEYICLSLPMIKVYDCEDDEVPPCDEEMLDHLYGKDDETDHPEESKSNPLWDALKGLKNNEN